MTSILNQAPFLRVQRTFPEETKELVVQLDKAYIDIANTVNARTIGLFAKNKPAINGEEWFLGNQTAGNIKQQALRQVYTFTGTGNIAHNISNFSDILITKPSGSFTDGTNWYGVIYAGSTTIAGQVTFYLTPTNIVIQAGAGAPAITSGFVVIEWLSQP